MVTRRAFIAATLGTVAAERSPLRVIANPRVRPERPSRFGVQPPNMTDDEITQSRLSTGEIVWMAEGYLFLHSQEVGRTADRKVIVSMYEDGSGRVAFCPLPTNEFDHLTAEVYPGRRFIATTIAPASFAGFWQGLFARSAVEQPPTYDPRPVHERGYPRIRYGTETERVQAAADRAIAQILDPDRRRDSTRPANEGKVAA